jgi:hypothetical protein
MDYGRDGCVHRLMENKADGKVAELRSAALLMGVGPGPRKHSVPRKIKAMEIGK